MLPERFRLNISNTIKILFVCTMYKWYFFLKKKQLYVVFPKKVFLGPYYFSYTLNDLQLATSFFLLIYFPTALVFKSFSNIETLVICIISVKKKLFHVDKISRYYLHPVVHKHYSNNICYVNLCSNHTAEYPPFTLYFFTISLPFPDLSSLFCLKCTLYSVHPCIYLYSHSIMGQPIKTT